MRFLFNKVTLSVGILLILGTLGLGEFIFWRVLKVSCSNDQVIEGNTPFYFVADGRDQGPFRGERWNRWVDEDLSKWFLKSGEIEAIDILDTENELELSSWWFGNNYPEEKRTIIIVHGINSSKKHYNQLMPATMLANAGFNVLMFDQRNHGDSSCPSGRYFAGTREWEDLNTVIDWLIEAKKLDIKNIGIHAVSGGTLATQFLMAERSDIPAFSLDSPVFDFEEIVKSELRWNGIPPIIWRLAVFMGKLHGIDIYEKSPRDGIQKIGNRALMVMHGTDDTRVPFLHSERLVKFASSLGKEVKFIVNNNSDHNEALLMEPELIRKNLIEFFEKNLTN